MPSSLPPVQLHVHEDGNETTTSNSYHCEKMISAGPLVSCTKMNIYNCTATRDYFDIVIDMCGPLLPMGIGLLSLSMISKYFSIVLILSQTQTHWNFLVMYHINIRSS